MRNEYIPYPARVISVREESSDTRTFQVKFEDKEQARSFEYRPGQFVQISLLGIGEAPISITSSPHRRGFIELSIRAAGRLTRALNGLNPGDRLYIRGPYGNAFPFAEVKGRDLCFVAGGIGLPPLRSVINYALAHRKEFGRIRIFYGARTPAEHCFKEELEEWGRAVDTEVRLIVDEADEEWEGMEGVVTETWREEEMEPGSVAYVCGPPVMLKFVVEKLLRSGFAEDDIYLTLERHMKCGVGKCGHCNIGGKFVCTDGPVFSYNRLKELPEHEKAL